MGGGSYYARLGTEQTNLNTPYGYVQKKHSDTFLVNVYHHYRDGWFTKQSSWKQYWRQDVASNLSFKNYPDGSTLYYNFNVGGATGVIGNRGSQSVLIVFDNIKLSFEYLTLFEIEFKPYSSVNCFSLQLGFLPFDGVEYSTSRIPYSVLEDTFNYHFLGSPKNAIGICLVSSYENLQETYSVYQSAFYNDGTNYFRNIYTSPSSNSPTKFTRLGVSVGRGKVNLEYSPDTISIDIPSNLSKYYIPYIIPGGFTRRVSDYGGDIEITEFIINQLKM